MPRRIHSHSLSTFVFGDGLTGLVGIDQARVRENGSFPPILAMLRGPTGWGHGWAQAELDGIGRPEAADSARSHSWDAIRCLA